mmetsp:Transcript_58134/g.177129  ORF Transcript_58134/g.177129 Transcript_58134/m.177129 type:complete len:366 (-) Transcript_58134:564-1661(-)
MVLNRVKVLSLAELNVWKCDADTEVPSDTEASPALDMSFEEGHSDADGADADGGPGHPWSARSSSGHGAAGHPSSSSTVRAVRAPMPASLQNAPAAEQFVAAFRTPSQGLKAIFLDYDGTLREFEARPELAVPTAEVHRLLSALNSREDLLVHIVSGRDAQFLNTHLGCYERLILIAEHERRVAGRFQVWRPEAEVQGVCQAEPMQDWRATVRFEMSRISGRLSGSQVEEKATSLVWHFRAVADEAAGEAAAESLAGRLVQMVKARRFRDLKVSRHSKAIEVSCRNGNKGQILRRICESRAGSGEPFEAVLIAGDDVSDEPMFEAGAGDAYLTVKVGLDNTTTMAKYCVDSPAQLRQFLWRCLTP